MGLTVHDTTLGTTAGNLGFEGITFAHPVFIGDTITAETEVIGKRRSASRGRRSASSSSSTARVTKRGERRRAAAGVRA